MLSTYPETNTGLSPDRSVGLDGTPITENSISYSMCNTVPSWKLLLNAAG